MRFNGKFSPPENHFGVVLVGVLLATSAWGDSAKIVSAIDPPAPTVRLFPKKSTNGKSRSAGIQEFGTFDGGAEETWLHRDRRSQSPGRSGERRNCKNRFRAELKGKGPGPTITIMLEYDALANGHSCGHNLIATSGLLAAAGLAKIMADTPGRVIVMGTPDEERGARGMGKVALLEGGHFDGTDVALITHPGDRWSLDQRLLANTRTFFAFKENLPMRPWPLKQG